MRFPGRNGEKERGVNALFRSSRLISARHLNSRLCCAVIIPSFPFCAPLSSNSSLGSGGDVEQKVEKRTGWDNAKVRGTVTNDAILIQRLKAQVIFIV